MGGEQPTCFAPVQFVQRPISFHSPIDAAVFDGEVLAGVRRMIAPERLREYLRDLDRQLQRLIASDPRDESLGGRAHKIVSQAGMLGLTRMSQCARALEDACRRGSGEAEALAQCRLAVRDVELHAMPAMKVPSAV